MTVTEFIKTCTPNYLQRERDFIANYTNRAGFFPQELRLWRESLFPEALENYTNKILDFANERRRTTIQ
jgi:hypothetical protein